MDSVDYQTRAPQAPRAMTFAARISGVLALLFCIGLAIAVLIRKFAPPNMQQ